VQPYNGLKIDRRDSIQRFRSRWRGNRGDCFGYSGRKVFIEFWGESWINGCSLDFQSHSIHFKSRKVKVKVAIVLFIETSKKESDPRTENARMLCSVAKWRGKGKGG
jgi:hypothetical protein